VANAASVAAGLSTGANSVSAAQWRRAPRFPKPTINGCAVYLAVAERNVVAPVRKCPPGCRTKIIAGLAIATLAAIPATAHAALTDNVGWYPPQALGRKTTCQDRLQFGMTADHIPFECKASLIEMRTTPAGHQEKWKYEGGFLFFNNGILMAIRQMQH
jgi:hypothetical protein